MNYSHQMLVNVHVFSLQMKGLHKGLTRKSAAVIGGNSWERRYNKKNSRQYNGGIWFDIQLSSYLDIQLGEDCPSLVKKYKLVWQLKKYHLSYIQTIQILFHYFENIKDSQVNWNLRHLIARNNFYFVSPVSREKQSNSRSET